MELSPKVLYLAALVALLVAYAGRAPAVWYGYPFEGHPDEAVVVERAYHTARTGDLDPHGYNYSGFTSYTLAAVFGVVEAWKDGVLGDASYLAGAAPTPEHFVVGRVLVLLLSALTLVATAEAGRRAVSPLAGIAAACFLAVAPLPTKFSFTVSANVAAAFWSVACLLASLRVLRGGRLWDSALAGLLAGFAVGSKYNALPVVASVLAAHLLPHDDGRRRPHTHVLVAGALVALGFLAWNPYAVLDPAAFLESVRRLQGTYAGSRPPLNTAAAGTSFHAYAAGLWKGAYGGLSMSLALVGLSWLALRRWRHAVVLGSYPLLLWLLLGSHRVFFLRNFIAAVPFLAVMSGAGLHAASRALEALGGRAPRGFPGRALARSLALALGAACLWPAARVSSRIIHSHTLPDTRGAALDWVLTNVPPGSRILREPRTPAVEDWTDRYTVRCVRSVVLPDRRGPISEACDYALTTMAFSGAIRRAPEQRAVRAAYEEFSREHGLVADFRGNGRELRGPRIRIYRIEPRGWDSAPAARPARSDPLTPRRSRPAPSPVRDRSASPAPRLRARTSSSDGPSPP